MRDWRIRRRAFGLGRPYDQTGMNGHSALDSPWSHSDPEADEYEAACTKHINTSYSSWDSLSRERKQEQWHEACVNALTHEQERHRETRDRMERLENQVQSLRAELNARNSPEYGATTFPLSPGTALEALKASPDMAMWDYDALISKWRTRIEHERSRQLPLPGSSTPWFAPSPIGENSQTPTHTDGQAHPAKPEHRQSTNQLNGSGSNGTNQDEELVDAPGEEDDTAVEMDQGLLDPNLREKTNGHQDSVMGNGSPQGKG